eukprot:Nitzschia sp. Nitz4//scaffold20_size174350//155481//155609//NITZ4_002131-RA/size174350-exonerate_est2genome-gene-0.210-mRNA-1//-1//CDS//3329541896//3319//frame0
MLRDRPSSVAPVFKHQVGLLVVTSPVTWPHDKETRNVSPPPL